MVQDIQRYEPYIVCRASKGYAMTSNVADRVYAGVDPKGSFGVSKPFPDKYHHRAESCLVKLARLLRPVSVKHYRGREVPPLEGAGLIPALSKAGLTGSCLPIPPYTYG